MCAVADEILEIGVADDDPVVAVLVGLALDLRAARLRDRLDELVDVVERAPELTRRLRLERDRRGAGGLQPELGLQRDGGGRQREEPVFLRLGELLRPEENVPQRPTSLTRPGGPSPARSRTARRCASRAAGGP